MSASGPTNDEARRSEASVHPTTAPPASGREGQLRSAFWSILDALCHSCSGSLAACLVDEEGESVDMAARRIASDAGMVPSLAAYRIKLAGAHWQIVMRHTVSQLPGTRQLWVSTEQFGYVVMGLQHGYVLAFLCQPESLGSVSARALRQCEIDLCLEAGWAVPEPDAICWRRAGVHVGQDGTPIELRMRDISSGPLVLLGPGSTAASFERGFRVRTPRGDELELVREPTGFWYAGGPLDALCRSRSRF